jgi:Domain of unknown function (DUF397)
MSGMENALDVGATNDSRGWRRSSRSYGTGNCIEVAVLHSERIIVRDSKDPNGVVLILSRTQWDSFVRACAVAFELYGNKSRSFPRGS